MAYRLCLVYTIIGLVFIQYQHCAPSPEFLEGGGPSLAQAQVTGIDQVQVGQLSFVQEKVSTLGRETMLIVGLCEQNGALIGWTLESLDGEFIQRGLSECERGSFEVSLNQDWRAFCGQDLRLKAALGAKASSEIVVEAVCP